MQHSNVNIYFSRHEKMLLITENGFMKFLEEQQSIKLINMFIMENA